MNLSLEIPELGMGIRKARISHWNVGEGEAIEFGNTVCVLQVREWEMAGRTKDASRLTKLRKKNRQSPSGTVPMRCPSCGTSDDVDKQLTCEDCLRFSIIASEPGTLSSIRSSAGQEVRIGDTIAHVEAEGENTSGSTAQAKMRIVVDLMDRAVGNL